MERPYVITISSEKGGVGKTTLATNLAIYLKALNEELPVTLFSFDNHFSVDRMFRIGRRPGRGDIADLFAGRPAAELVEIGEYGVQFIPSSQQLSDLRERLSGVDILARLLADAPLGGVIIIDTRPDLDIFTRNALYAADRVIVPVKDAPSLENCRNLYQFFDRQGLSRRALRLLPCLVDSRIHYQGPFRDPHQLIKAYAINRGYRCFEGFIAKSPKVESLNTNPEGKIYPILTHGRGTEVHLQMLHLARQVYLGMREESERRLSQVHREMVLQQQARSEAFATRRQALQPGCLLCGRPLASAEAIGPAGYYGETSDGRLAGFVEEGCFTEAVFRHFYGTRREIGPADPLRDLFRESAQRSCFVLRRAPHTRNFYQQQLSFYRFDDEGLEVSHKSIDLPATGRDLPQDGLFHLVASALGDPDGRLGDHFLLISRVGSDFPEEILYDEQHDRLRRLSARIGAQLKEN